MKKMIVPLSIMLLFILLIPGIASAKSIFEHNSTTVPAGETIDDLYVVGGDASVYGHVTGAVVVINGNLLLSNTADVDGIVLVFGGEVKQESGAKIGDDVYNISLDNETQNSLLIGGGLILGLWVLKLAVSLLCVLIPVLIRIIGKRKAASFIDKYQQESAGRLLYTGLLTSMILMAISILLIVTIIGIPLLIIVLIIIIVAFALGSAVVSYRVGELFKGTLQKSEWIKVLIGASVIVAFANIPIIGWIVIGLVMLISFGICTQWIAGKLRRKKTS
ncbi:MAG: hypothetical protein WDZ91_15850 [Paenibacillaceae bacterium]